MLFDEETVLATRIAQEINVEIDREVIADIAQFSRISIPLVRRIYPQLIANEIMAIQPLQSPVGLQFYERWRYPEIKHREGLAKIDWKTHGF